MFSFVLAGFVCLAHPVQAQNSDSDDPLKYVGSDTCRNCHEDAATDWDGSHHALAWTAPTKETVAGDFDDSSFHHKGVLTRFWQQNGTFRINEIQADGTEKTYTVHSVAGIEPLQQYLVETEPGRLQSFDVVWDTERNRWFHLYPDQDLPADDGLHWTGPYKNWNGRCAECHATGFQKNFDATTKSYQSSQSEVGVGCEACHGPGSRHVDWAGRNVSSAIAPPTGYGFTMDFANAGTEATLQQCAGCHSRREPMGDGNPIPGTAFDDAYTLSLLRPGLYYPDGQIQDEVYVYGSFLQSKMYAEGVGCLNCHNAHTADLVAEGNGVCVQCHSAVGNPDFPTLTLKIYDDPEHHFHAVGSQGAECKNCHMPEKVYMGVDGRSDHGFRIPQPEMAKAIGAPDTCTSCHADQSPSWAAAEIAKRYPNSGDRAAHYGLTLFNGRADPVAAAPELIALALDSQHPALVRATALWLLSQGADEMAAETVAPLLEDDNPNVRAAAIGVQVAASPQTQVQRIIGFLADPSKMVRIEAAKSLLNAPIARLPQRIQSQMQSAMAEWRSSLQARLDFPETHMVLGGMALSMRNIPAAKRAFREVIAMDPQREEAWVILTRIAAAVDGRDATVIVLNEALRVLPENETLLGIRASIPEE